MVDSRRGTIGRSPMARLGRVYRSWADREAREGQADVDRAVETLGVVDGRICGTIPDLRRRWDALLDDLHPPPRPLDRRRRWLRRLGFGTRARAADNGLAHLLGEVPVGAGMLVIRVWQGAGDVASGVFPRSPLDGIRGLIADALDAAYCELLPQEAVRRAHERARFWAAAREGQRRREFVARCFGRPD